MSIRPTPNPLHLVRIARSVAVAALLALCACAGRGAPPDYPPLKTMDHAASDGEGDVSISLSHVEFRFADDGTFTETYHDTYQVLTEDGVNAWGNSQSSWSPWHMDRPTIRATVKSPDGGTTSVLEPSALIESAASDDTPEVYGDARVLRAPLPNVRVGSTVDETIVMKSNRPFPSGAESYSTLFEGPSPRKRVELVVDVPEGMALLYAVRGAKVDVSDTRAGGRRVLRFTGGPFDAVDALEDGLPSDVVRWPHVSFTTGKDWGQVAAAYAKIVDEKIAGGQLEAVVAKIVAPGDTPTQKAQKLLGWVHERVRYVGVELGASSIIPATPDETLRRGYGDCKDQAVTLVALLRAAGVPAKVALLDAGDEEDVDPSMPALNVFNHAIVVIPAATPMWIDPTATRARAGELPGGDDGRYALVADADTVGLVRTPPPSEKANRYHEIRRVTLGELGAATIVETSTSSGAVERALRGTFDATPAATDKWLKGYVERVYGSSAPGRLETSKLDDTSIPFTTTIEVQGATRSWTEALEATAEVGPNDILGWLPKELTRTDERKGDFWLTMPYEAELDFEVRPPAGFVLSGDFDVGDVPMGPATLRRRLEKRDGGVVVVAYHFVLPNASWTAKQVNEFRAAYAAFDALPKHALTFVHEGKKAHDERRYEDEVAIFRRDVANDPTSAIAKVRLAQALVTLGFGASARALVDEAQKLAPDDETILEYAGYVRARDLFGRWLHAGADFEGAADAYRAALRVAPSSVFSAVNLSYVLEHAPDGTRYAPGAKLDEAVTVLDHIDPKKLAAYEGGTFVASVFFDLLWLGRYDEVRARVRKMDPAKAPVVPAIVAAAMLGGPSEGVAEATRLKIDDAQRPTDLVNAAKVLIRLRRYPEATALLAASAALSSDAQVQARVETISKVVPIDPDTLPEATPEDVVRKVIGVCTAGLAGAKDKARALYSTRGDVADIDAFCDSLHAFSGAYADPLPPLVMSDLARATLRADVEGSDAVGFRVTTAAPWQTASSFFVVRENRGYRLRATTFSAAGCEALAMAKGGRREAATKWLTWLRPLVVPGTGVDPLRDEPFLTLWTGPGDDVEVGAASLCAAGGDHVDLAVPVLTAAVAKASASRATTLELALAEAESHLDHFTELLATAKRLMALAPTSERAWALELRALTKLQRFQEMRDEAAARVAKDPTNPNRLLDLVEGEAAVGHFVEARAVGERLMATHPSGSSAYNEHAWLSMFTTVTEKDRQYALTAVNAAPRSAIALNTLAAVDIALGHTADAHDRLLQTLELRADKQPSSADWYVLGRIAERLGLVDEAKAAYAHVPPAKSTGNRETIRLLVDDRLRLLK